MLLFSTHAGPPTTTLFPYTTLFRSPACGPGRVEDRPDPPPASARGCRGHGRPGRDRKSTRLNSSHMSISYAVFCLKKKTEQLPVLVYIYVGNIDTYTVTSAQFVTLP